MRAFALAAVISLLAASSAHAAIIRTGSESEGCDPSACSETFLDVIAAPGEANRLEMTNVPGGVLLMDSGARLRGCRGRPDGSRLCRGSFDNIDVELGDGSDTLRMEGLERAGVSDGPGDDSLELVNGDYSVSVGEGADLVVLDVGAVWYGDRAGAVTVRLNGLADDGEAGEGDDVRGRISYMAGGRGRDLLEAGAANATLVGNDGDDTLLGGPGNDRLFGYGGSDQLMGGDGDDLLDPTGGAGDADVVSGGSGLDEAEYVRSGARVRVSLGDGPNDGVDGEGDDVGSDVENLTGTYGPDVLTGDAGPNVIDGGAGSDSLRGGAGEDTLLDREYDDRDLIDPGPGPDTVEASAGDWVVAADGEADRVDCGSSGLPLDWDMLDLFTRCAPRAVVTRAKRRGRRVDLLVRCEPRAAESCTGTLVLRRRGVPVTAPLEIRALTPGRSLLAPVLLRRPVRGCLGALTTTVRREPPSRTRWAQPAVLCPS